MPAGKASEERFLVLHHVLEQKDFISVLGTWQVTDLNSFGKILYHLLKQQSRF